MAWVWNPFGFPGVVTGAAALAIAVLVYFTRPTRLQNRALALVLFLEATVAITGTGFMFLTDSYATAYAWQAVTVVALLAVPPMYLLFLSTLETPLARPLRPRAVRAVLVALAVVLPFAWFAARDSIVVGLYQAWFSPWEVIPGTGWFLVLGAGGVVYLYGLAAALSAWRRTAPGTLARSRAKAFALAFGTRDATWAAIIAMPMVVPAMAPSTHWGSLVYALGPPLIQLLYLPLLGYGILKTQLFDVDVRIKRGVRRSIVAAAFVGAFVVATALAQRFLESRFEFLAGVAGAIALAFAFRPLERAAGRLADRAMPGVRDDPVSLEARKIDVYRAALEGAVQDGVMTARERAMLRRLRENLGVAETDAERVERELLAGATA